MTVLDSVCRWIKHWYQQHKRKPRIVRSYVWFSLGLGLFPLFGMMLVPPVYFWWEKHAGLAGNGQVQFNKVMSWMLYAQVLILIAIVILVARYRKAIRGVKKQGGLACPECQYDLGPLPAAGKCPECGREYTHDELRQTWKPYMANG